MFAHASFLKFNDSNKKVRDVATTPPRPALCRKRQHSCSRVCSWCVLPRDHALLPRVLSNGGLAAFANFAKHSSEPFQLLIRTAYDKARRVYRHLFERKPLDWLLDGEDAGYRMHCFMQCGSSRDGIHHCPRNILSGIYDRNLDRSQRQALGEVYTRPELAAYMLSSCGYDGTQHVLDPACGSGTFLVEAFEAARQRKVGAGFAFTPEDAIETLERLHGLDLNSFSATLCADSAPLARVSVYNG